MSADAASFGPTNVAFGAITNFLSYWAYALLFLSICLLVRDRHLLIFQLSEPSRTIPALYYSAFALLIIFGIVTSSLATDYEDTIFNLFNRINLSISQVVHKAELTIDLRYTYVSIWYLASACLVGYAVYTHLKLKRASINDKVGRTLLSL